MGKVGDKEIYESKPWLNVTPQNVEGITKVINGTSTVPKESKNGESK